MAGPTTRVQQGAAPRKQAKGKEAAAILWEGAEQGQSAAAAEDEQPWLAMTRDLNTSSLDFRSTSIPIPWWAGGIML